MDCNKHQEHGTPILIPILFRMNFKYVFVNTLDMSNRICWVILLLCVSMWII